MTVEEAALRLGVEERLRLIEVLWDSLTDHLTDEAPLELSAEVKAELDERLAAHRREPDAALSWDEIKDRVLSRSRVGE